MSTLITIYTNLVGVDDEASHSNDVLLEAKEEHKGDKVEILLEGEFIITCIYCNYNGNTGYGKHGSYLIDIIL